MQEVILNKKLAFTGSVVLPNKDIFPREIITGLVLESVYITNERRNNNILDTRYQDYKLEHSNVKSFLNTYFIDYLKALKGIDVIQMESWGNYLMPNESTQIRNNFLYKDLNYVPYCQMIYGAFIKDTIDIVLEINPYDRKVFKLKNNDYIIFDTDINYFIGKNNSNNTAVLFTTTFSKFNEINNFI